MYKLQNNQLITVHIYSPIIYLSIYVCIYLIYIICLFYVRVTLHRNKFLYNKNQLKVKQSRYRPGVPQRVPGSLGSQIS